MTSPAKDPPPCLIRIDKEGRLFHQGAPMIHPGINALLLEHLTRDDEGRYIIEFEGQRCWVEVEDAPLMVQRVDVEAADGQILLTLSHGGQEPLDPEQVWIDEANVVYTQVRHGRLPAKFSRPAYYQLAALITETPAGFGLELRGRVYTLRSGRPA